MKKTKAEVEWEKTKKLVKIDTRGKGLTNERHEALQTIVAKVEKSTSSPKSSFTHKEFITLCESCIGLKWHNFVGGCTNLTDALVFQVEETFRYNQINFPEVMDDKIFLTKLAKLDEVQSVAMFFEVEAFFKRGDKLNKD